MSWLERTFAFCRVRKQTQRGSPAPWIMQTRRRVHLSYTNGSRLARARLPQSPPGTDGGARRRPSWTKATSAACAGGTKPLPAAPLRKPARRAGARRELLRHATPALRWLDRLRRLRRPAAPPLRPSSARPGPLVRHRWRRRRRRRRRPRRRNSPPPAATAARVGLGRVASAAGDGLAWTVWRCR